jgi:hypothetical protein
MARLPLGASYLALDRPGPAPVRSASWWLSFGRKLKRVILWT